MPHVDSKTWIPLGSASAVVLTLVSGIWWMSVQFHTIDTRLFRIESHIANRWTAQDMEVWYLRSKENGTMVDPVEVLRNRRNSLN